MAMTRMPSPKRETKTRHGERGNTLFIVAGALAVLLGIAALAIDLASLYVARNESQRAADAGALAGAKVFVESGCVTSGDCTSAEAAATARATEVAQLNLVEGQPVTISAVKFKETPRNPQITVQVRSADLNVYFAGAIGVTTAPTVGATATAEAYNPSGSGKGPDFCTSCVRPWLVPNCDADASHGGPANPLCTGTQAYLLNPSSNFAVENPGCYPGGVIGEPLQIVIETPPGQLHFGVVDDGTGLSGYQRSITTCNTGQMTCGMTVNTLPGTKIAYTPAGVGSLLHIGAGNVGLNQGQDWIDTTACPPQIHAGRLNPLVVQGVIAEDALVATSDSIVTVYLYDGSPLKPAVSQSVTIRGFAQIFVTEYDANGDVRGVILGLAGCSDADRSCGSGSIHGPTMFPVRLISPAAN
jgi:hypothetical protein